jgi:hypothetical protein
MRGLLAEWTEDRREVGTDSLGATLNDSWTDGCLPVLTVADKRRFERDREYTFRVAADIAEILFGIACDRSYCDQRRLYVPRQWP